MSGVIDMDMVRQGDALLAEAYRLAGDKAETLAMRQAQWIANGMEQEESFMDTPPARGRPRQAPTVAVSVRMTTDLLDRVDGYIDTLAARIPGLRLERSRGICLMLERLFELEASATQPQPQPAPPIQAQPPLALEPAPATEVQPARKSQTSSSRRRDGKGGNPGIPDEKLQQIADTAAEYDKMSLQELSQLLFERGIHRATDSTTGQEKPVHPGTLKKQLDRARQQGLL
jgi:hypothetical protein